MKRDSHSVLIAVSLSTVVLACAPPTPTIAPVPTQAPTAQRTTVPAPPTPTAAPTAAPTTPPPAPKPTVAPTSQPTLAPAGDFDRQLIDMMVPHHEGAIEMAKIAEERAERPEIKAMAADILRTQAAEIEQMKAWRKAWYGSDATPPMSEMPMVEGMQMRAGGHGDATTMNMAADVERLRGAAEPFDLAFIAAMIPHHQDAVEAARATFQRNTRPEIRTLATAIINAQTREIATMEEWRRVWSVGSGTEPAQKDEHAGEH